MSRVDERDVIVVGAGPAGAATASILAQQGLDVLLIDRHSFPRDKACGDAIPAGAVDILRAHGMDDKVAMAVERGEFYPLRQMRLVSPRGHVLEAKFDASENGSRSYVAPRVYFDTVVQQHALDSGAKFMQATVKQPVLVDGKVVGVEVRSNGASKQIGARVVVGADGVTSVITRALRPDKGKHVDGHRAVALRAYIENIEEFPNEVEFYLYQEILPGYAWIFPIGEGRANIGLGMRLDQFRARKGNLKRMLDEFLNMPAIKERLRPGWEVRDVATWQLNFGSQKRLQHAFNGALLVGDAAGFINPLTGGGIHNALLSAELAAQTIQEAFAQGDVSQQGLKIYEERCDEAMWDGLRRSYWLQVWLLRFPFIIDFLVRRLKENSTLARTFLTKL